MAVWRAIAVGLVLLGTCVVPTASGEEAERAPAQSGMRVYIDPQTGRFAPGPVDPSQRLEPAPASTRPPVVAVPRPDGSLEVTFDERHRKSVVATVDADGRVHLDCVTGDGSHELAGE
jgi:hypothetical protein